MRKRQLIDGVSAAPLLICGAILASVFFTGPLWYVSCLVWIIFCDFTFSIQLTIIKNETYARVLFFIGGLAILFLTITIYSKN